jgi:voltage-gated potassium channel
MYLDCRIPAVAPTENYQRLLQRRQLSRVIALGLGVLLFGTVSFRLIEGWPWFECLYFTVISVTTVGFAEIHEPSQPGRLIVMLIIGGGLLTTALAVNMIGLHLLSNFHARNRTKMQRLINDISQHVILCGHGRLGQIVRKELDEAGRSYVVIEENADAIAELEAEGVMCLHGDATDEELLQLAGVERASGVIAAIGSDAGNVFITLTTRQYNSKCPIVARAEDPSSERKLKLVGATRVVTPYQLGGRRLAHAFLRPSAVELAELALGGHNDHEVLIEEVELPAGAQPKITTLGELELGKRFRLIAVAVRPTGEDRPQFNPAADRALGPGDHLMLMGLREDLDACIASLTAAHS